MTFTKVWCNDCGDAWQADRAYVCAEDEQAPPCPACQSEETESFGEPED